MSLIPWSSWLGQLIAQVLRLDDLPHSPTALAFLCCEIRRYVSERVTLYRKDWAEHANALRNLVQEQYEIIPCWVRDADFAEEILALNKKTNDTPNTVDDAEHEIGEPDC